MNNNANGKGKESDISTKKGFLISIPGKKKGASDGESSINLSKPQNVSVKRENSQNVSDKKHITHDGATRNDAVKENRYDKNRKNNQHKQKNSDKFQKEVNQNRNEEKSAQKNAKEFGGDNRTQQKGDKNFDKQKHFDKKGKGSRQNKRENYENDRGGAEPKEKRSNNNAHSGKDFSKDRTRDKKQRQAPLSALSGDIAQKSHFGDGKSSFAESVTALSLEEKYKNAKPLAEQIAEQEMRSKGIKIPENAENSDEELSEIVGVRFREAGKIYYFDPDGKEIPFGTPVIVETSRGSEYGFVAISNRKIPTSGITSPLKKIERLASASDTQKHLANKDLEKDAQEVFKEKVEKLSLPMNLIYVEYTFDNSRLLFYFTAETRIDFRELVKELAGVFRTRIELRQIGVRDEAKALGGIGICGRATCCNTFLSDFAQVSIKMAKDQSLSLNAAKISGACGKLMCCLRYEDKVYEEENAITPKVGSIVETPDGKGCVVERNALKGIVNVHLDSAPDAPPKPFSRDDVTVVGFNKSKSDEDVDSEELKSLQDS